MDAHSIALLPIEEESPAPIERAPGEKKERITGKVVREKDPELAELPGEAGEPSVDEGFVEPSETPAPGLGEPLPASAWRWWRRRQILLFSAAAIALGIAVASAFLASPSPVPRTASTAQHGVKTGIPRAEPLAPAASLASVPTEPAEPVTREKSQPMRKDQQLQEILALHDAAPDGSRRDGPSAKRPPSPGSPAAGRDAHPSDLNGPPPGYVAREPGSKQPSSVAPPGAQPSAVADDGASSPPAAAPPPPPAGEAPHDATAAVLASLGPASKPPEPSPLSPRPPEPTRASPPVAEPGKHTDPVETAGDLHAEPLTPADQVQVLELVTQMAAIVRDLRSQQAQLRADLGKTAADNVAHLADFERRLALAEARHAISAAQIAGEPLGSAPSVSDAAPAGETLPPNRSSAEPAGSAPAGSAQVVVTPIKAALPSSDKGATRRYRVQAASPGLALLAEIDRGGGDGAQLEVLVGDTVPGYGKITSIGQRGTAWVVTTEHGNIQ